MIKKKSLAALLVDDFDKLEVKTDVNHPIEASIPNLYHALDSTGVVAGKLFVDLGALDPRGLNKVVVRVNRARVVGFFVDDVFHFFVLPSFFLALL